MECRTCRCRDVEPEVGRCIACDALIGLQGLVHSSRLPASADRPRTSLLLGVLAAVRFMEHSGQGSSVVDAPGRWERSRSRGDSHQPSTDTCTASVWQGHFRQRQGPPQEAEGQGRRQASWHGPSGRSSGQGSRSSCPGDAQLRRHGSQKPSLPLHYTYGPGFLSARHAR